MLVASAGCKHEGCNRIIGGGVEIKIEVCEQLYGIDAAKRSGSMHGQRAVIGSGGAKIRAVSVSRRWCRNNDQV